MEVDGCAASEAMLVNPTAPKSHSAPKKPPRKFLKKLTNILKDILRIIAINQSSAGALCPVPLTNNDVSTPSPLQIPETSRQQNQIPPLGINPSPTASGSWESHPVQQRGILLPSCSPRLLRRRSHTSPEGRTEGLPPRQE